MTMQFYVDPSAVPVPGNPDDIVIVLARDNWDDFGFGTSFSVSVLRHGQLDWAGITKIGRRGMESQGAFGPTFYTEIDPEFPSLPDNYFSVGQDASLYATLVEWLGQDHARDVLQSLRDTAAIPGLLQQVLDETVALKSLFRTVSIRTVRDQYQRILQGLADHEKFSLRYRMRPDDIASPEMEFTVDPGRTLPSNVHVIIGANGTGKTTALKNIRWALDTSDERYRPDYLDVSDREKITGLVSVSFSAFDVFPESPRDDLTQANFPVTLVGLPPVFDGQDAASESSSGAARNPSTLSDRDWQQRRYQKLIEGCLKNREMRLLTAFGFLADADAVLDSHGIRDAEALMRIDFPALSSGHKIVLLTVASLVLYCEEKSLALIDEPESHLHAPLLGAFTRALSWLMTDTNGLAIVATHSAVVMQEVPKRCAWKLWSVGGETRVAKPSIETFGENLGLLTREVFGLELDKSGYHALLRRIAADHNTYDDAIKQLRDEFDDENGDEIGDEAKLLLRSMIYARTGA